MNPSEDKPGSSEEFLSRWSRRKQQARAEAQSPQPAAKPVAQPEPPPLPPLESLTPESDFSGFLHPKVDAGLRRAALKKLFSDPHFNVMDGLDVYIDDYSVSDPIPEEMLKQLKQAQDIIVAGKERREAAAKAEAEEAARLAAAEARALPAATGTETMDRVDRMDTANTAEPVDRPQLQPAADAAVQDNAVQDNAFQDKVHNIDPRA